MNAQERTVRHISDTARWAAVFRARETDRPDALFRDPYAARLAGEQGQQIAAAFPFHNQQAWSWVTRTCLFDRLIEQQIVSGTDLIINLAAGLDARPYRMELPPNLWWAEVDFPEVLDYKEQLLAADKPRCRLQRVRLDLADLATRRAFLSGVSSKARRVVAVTEGLLIYLTECACGELAEELARYGFATWVLDIASPGLLAMLQQEGGSQLDAAGARLRFAPREGPRFFENYGWAVEEVHSILKTAAHLGRLPEPLKDAASAPEPPPHEIGDRPWSGVCLLRNATTPS